MSETTSQSSGTHSSKDIQTAAQEALKGLEIAKSIGLDKLLNIERQLKWCNYYMYGVDLNAIGSNPSDPRRMFTQTKVEQCGDIPTAICTTYADFVSTYKPQFYFLYLKPTSNTEYALNVLYVDQCEEIISNLLSVDENNHEIDCIMAGLNYFGKLDYFNEVLTNHNMNESYMSKIKKYTNTNKVEYVNMIENRTLLSKTLGIEHTYFKILGGYYFKQKSYVPTSLIEQYNEFNTKYQKELNDMMEILKNTPKLQLCWASAENKEINITNNEQTAAGINTTAAVNCMSDAVVDGFMNGASLQEVTVKQIYIAIDNLEARNKERTAELETKLMVEQQQNLQNSFKKNIIITVSISICVIILVFFFFLLMNGKINSIKSKLKGSFNYQL